jgi:DNA ligase D-like protein (predicted polymerase)
MLIEGLEVPLTNQDKVFFPRSGATKGDLVRYYVSVASPVLNHVADRPMQMKRYPNGVDADFFYQKRVPVPHPDWLETVHVVFPSGRTADFPVMKNAASLAWLANLGCIELHTWHSRVTDVERPDYLLIDLDPSEGNPWAHVREIALATKATLDELGVPSFPKTSGVTGLHILVPIVVELEFPPIRELARAIAKLIEKRVPAISTTTWKVADRTGVFIDYGQNARDRTIASAYSIRPVEDARASAPLRWDEVGDVEPGDFTIHTMPARMRAVGDLTADMWSHRVSLTPLFERLDVKLEAPKRRVRSGPPVDWRAQYRERKEGASGEGARRGWDRHRGGPA